MAKFAYQLPTNNYLPTNCLPYYFNIDFGVIDGEVESLTKPLTVVSITSEHSDL